MIFSLILFFSMILALFSYSQFLVDYVVFDNNKYQVPMSLSDSDRSKSRNAIVFLIHKVSEHIAAKMLNMTNEMIDDNLSADVIIFHGHFPFNQEIKNLRAISKRKVDFVHIDSVLLRVSTIPNFDPYTNDPTWTKLSSGKWNYHHMIRFWFSDIFSMPIMSNVEYFMRLDDDSQLLSQVPNIWERMKRMKVVYIANDIFEESSKNLPGTDKLQSITKEYIQKNHLQPRNRKRYENAFPGNKSVYMFYNNFEVVSQSFFLSDAVVRWTKFIIQTGGIYRYRWGDAPLRYLTMVLFARENQVMHRENLGFKYYHGRSHNLSEVRVPKYHWN